MLPCWLTTWVTGPVPVGEMPSNCTAVSCAMGATTTGTAACRRGKPAQRWRRLAMGKAARKQATLQFLGLNVMHVAGAALRRFLSEDRGSHAATALLRVGLTRFG